MLDLFAAVLVSGGEFAGVKGDDHAIELVAMQGALDVGLDLGLDHVDEFIIDGGVQACGEE